MKGYWGLIWTVLLAVLVVSSMYLLLLWKLPWLLQRMHGVPLATEGQMQWAVGLLQACVVFGGIASVLIGMRQVKSTERASADNRYMWAVEQLDKSTQLDARLGALKTLLRVAEEHPTEYKKQVREVIELRFRAHRWTAVPYSVGQDEGNSEDNRRQGDRDARALDLEECVRYLAEDGKEPLKIDGGTVALPIQIRGSEESRLTVSCRGVTFVDTKFVRCKFEELRKCTLIRCVIEDSVLPMESLDAEFEGCEFLKCDLRRTDWKRTFLRTCKFRNCNLMAASFRGVKAQNVRFQQGELNNADFHGADLSESSWYGAKLDGTSWQDANMTGAKVERVDMTTVVGLTQSQLDTMQPAMEVTLPRGLSEPEGWRPQAAGAPTAPLAPASR